MFRVNSAPDDLSASAEIERPLRRFISHPAALLAAGLLCLAPLVLTPTTRLTIAAGAIRHELGHAYQVPVSLESQGLFVSLPDSNESPRRSRLTLFENGKPLGPPHTLHATIREVGGGAYSHWIGSLYFSSSDNSDPRANGRTYVAEAGTRLNHAVAGLLILAALAALWAARRSVRIRWDQRFAAGAPALARREWSPPRIQPIAIALATTAAASVLAWLALPQYRTGDDVVMRFIAEGVTADGGQTEFILNQNVLIGLALRVLYGLVPAAPWYDIALAAGAAAGALLCQAAALRLCTSRLEVMFCVLLALAVFTPIFQAPQFSASAMLLSGGALSVLASVWLRAPGRRMHAWIAAAAAVAGFTWGTLIRFQAAFFVVMAILPVMVFFGFIHRRWRRSVFPAASLSCAITLAVLAQAFNTSYYARAPDWENFVNWKRQWARGAEYMQLDESRSAEFRAALAAARWTENDYHLLRGWLFSNEELFSSDRIARFADAAPLLSLTSRASRVADHLRRPAAHFGLFLLLCAAPLLLRRTWRALCLALASAASATVSLSIAGMVFKPGFFHIVWPLYAVVALANAGLIFASNPRVRASSGYLRMEDRAVAAVGLLAVGWLAGWQLTEVFAKGAATDEARRQLSHDLAAWPAGKDDVVVVWDHNFPFEIWARPFRPLQHTPWRLLHTTDVPRSPLVRSIYAQWGTSDIAWATCHMRGMYLVDAGLGYAGPHARMLTAYFKEHHDQAVDLARVFQGRALALYQCRSADRSAGGTER